MITNELMENTFLYCWKRLAHKEDAKDLAQEIIVDALLALRSGKIIKNFHALYWTIANHKLCDFYHRKRPSSVNYEEVENVLLAFAPEGSFYNKQGLLQILNNELAYLLFLTFWHTFPENEYLTLMPDGFYEDHNLLDELAVIFTWYFSDYEKLIKAKEAYPLIGEKADLIMRFYDGLIIGSQVELGISYI